MTTDVRSDYRRINLHNVDHIMIPITNNFMTRDVLFCVSHLIGPEGSDSPPSVAEDCGYSLLEDGGAFSSCAVCAGGETIKSINQQSGAHVELQRNPPPSTDHNTRVFTIRGSAQQMDVARQLIDDKIGVRTAEACPVRLHNAVMETSLNTNDLKEVSCGSNDVWFQ